MRIGTLKIGQRLTLGFGLAMVAMAAVIVFGAVQLVAIERGIDVIANERYPQTALANSIKSDSYEVVQGMRDILLLSDAQEIKDRITDLDQAVDFADQSLAELYRKPAVSAQENELRKNVSQARDDFKVELDSFKQLVLAGQRDMARDVLYTRAETARMAVFQSLNNVIAIHADATASSSHAALARASQAVMVMLALGGAACVLALAIGVLVRRSIVRPLQQAVALAGCVAEGDLAAAASIQTDSASRDETGVLVQSLKVMNDGLADIAGGVRRGTDAIATASAEIAHGSMDLAARTERQAASVERVVASMADLTRTVQQNADHARQAAQLAADASDVALKGGAVVEQVVDNMRSIHTSARKIEDITSVIDGIAFQTNILALNAAVEAARAGEQGRGFAVVAAEVRNLAQRSAGAAKEIKQLIVDSVQRINAGNTLAGQAGETMTDVVASVRQVAGIIVEISHASGEQSEGIGQLGNALAQIDAATSQNAALVEEAAAAAERMREEAVALADAVGFFKLAPVAGAGSDAAQPAPASPAPALIALPA